MLHTDLSERVRAPRTSFGDRVRGVTPGALAVFGALAILGVSTFLFARSISRYGAFIGDDIVGFWFARTLPLPRFMATPIDVHFVPLHRLVTYVVYWLAPLDFRLGLGVLLALHGATLIVLFRVACSVSNRSIAAVLVCLYGLNPSLGSLLIWWTSGLHRLGCVACVAVALLAYAKYRGSSNVRWLLTATMATAMGLGFYAKAVLIPAYIALIELNFVVVLGRRFEPRKLLASLGATLAVAVVYVIFWRLATDAESHTIAYDPRTLALFVTLGFRLFGPLVFGSWLNPQLSVAVVSAVAWCLLLLVTIAASRRALVAWGSFCLGVALNLTMISAAAAKTRLFGAYVLLSDRYYFEQMFLLVVFGAFAVQCGRERMERWLPARRGRLALVACALCALVALSLQARGAFRGLRKSVYSGSGVAARYMANLRAGLAGIPDGARKPLSLVDTTVPTALVPFGNVVNFNSQLLTLMGEAVRVDHSGGYRVEGDGRIVPLVPGESR
jgi:hypothetical protein